MKKLSTIITMGKNGDLPRTKGILLYHFFIIIKLTFVNNE